LGGRESPTFTHVPRPRSPRPGPQLEYTNPGLQPAVRPTRAAQP